MTRDPNWIEQDYRFYEDDGNLGSNTPKGDINTPVNITEGTKFRLRVNFGDDNNATQNNSRSVKLQYNVNEGGWNDVTSTSPIAYTTSAYVSDGTADPTERLSNISGSTFSIVYSQFDSNNSTPTRTWADLYAEFEFCLLENGVTVGQSVQFRAVTSSDEPPATFTNVPTMTVVSSSGWSGYSFDVTI